ncbi:MAG TPA: MaoC family dehydratase N-terminal domain-containing protein [Casimicrobiaceae bacterium]|nr:MaoC family dehydratase N-terminal domain-containing protein [Casimicrobiaceae bacterium]
MTTALDGEALRAWIGRTETRTDVLDARPVALLSATLDRDDPPPRPGDVLPPLWHWLYFLPAYRESEVGPDGHARRGGFLPPVPLPRRMWAGSRIEWLRPLAIGERVSRHSRIVSVTPKTGRSGALVFVVVRHELADAAGVALTEEHDIVYRDLPPPGAVHDASAGAAAAPDTAAWTRRIVPDDVLLFRYSALTFNSHRIHYDRRYVTEVEGYPGLVVHGPLLATLLVDLVRRQRPRIALRRFEFRALAPLFDIAPFDVCGRPEGERGAISLWVQDAQGKLAMRATATPEN